MLFRSPRLMRARRLVCAVFEDMLIDGETESRSAARIPRAAIMPVWGVFVDRADKARLAQLEQELTKPASVAELRQMFAATLKPELDDAAAFATLASRIAGQTNSIVVAATISSFEIPTQPGCFLGGEGLQRAVAEDRKSTRLNSSHT